MLPAYLRLPSLLGALALALPAAVDALERSCGPDPLANTADVLCAAPSGPCDAATVRVPLALDVLSGGGTCVFDLGGRALAVDATVQTPAGLRFVNAGDVTLGATGKLKARGDFLRPAGDLDDGGAIEIASAGSIALAGLLDVSGYDGGEIELIAAGGIVLHPSAEIRGNALGPLEDGERSGSGGVLVAEARGGSVSVQGPITLRGQAFGDGGDATLTAAFDLTLDAVVDVSGGNGGFLQAEAGDRAAVLRTLLGHSRGGGGDGGNLEVGVTDTLPLRFARSAPGGVVTLEGPSIDVRGSATDGFGGEGGSFTALSDGSVLVAPQTSIQVDGGPVPPGDAGSVTIDALVDVVMAGTASARGDAAGGDGSFFGLEFLAGRNLVLSGRAETSGGLDGGTVIAEAGGELTVTGVVRAVGTSPAAVGGTVELDGGLAADAAVIVATDLIATGGAAGSGGYVYVVGCTVEVRPGRLLDARASAADLNHEIILAAHHPIALGAHSRYRVGSGGIFLGQTPGVDPVVGPGIVFDQPPIHFDLPPDFFHCPPAVCGNGVREHGEQCDDGNADDGDGCAADCTARCRTLPAAGCRAAGESRLRVKDDANDARDRLDWTWQGGGTTVADLGSPLTDDDYLLCVYDESGPPALVHEAHVPAAALCNGKPCWRLRGRHGLSYRSRERTPDGVETLKLRAGETGNAAITAKARGAAVDPPALPIALPARVQLQAEHGPCWEAAYTSAKRNDTTRLDAATP